MQAFLSPNWVVPMSTLAGRMRAILLTLVGCFDFYLDGAKFDFFSWNCLVF